MLKKKIRQKMIKLVDCLCEDKIHKIQQQYDDLAQGFLGEKSLWVYKCWQNTVLNNQLFYELYLQNKNKRRNFHPKVSIIIPVYNGEKYLKEAIDSALAQTYDNYEIIVVNDGSTDKTETIAKSYGDKIRYIKKKNGGVSSALNLGIKKMRGEYFSWLSHDDLIDKNHIELLIDRVSYKGHEHHIPFATFKIIDKNGTLKFEETINAQIHLSDFRLSYLKNELSLLQGEINGGSVLIPRRAFNECGMFDEKLRISQERDLWRRLICKYHFINLPFDTASIRIHGDQVTSINPNVIEETNLKNLEIITLLPSATKRKLFGSEDAFYQHIVKFHTNHGKQDLATEIKNIRLNTKNT